MKYPRELVYSNVQTIWKIKLRGVSNISSQRHHEIISRFHDFKIHNRARKKQNVTSNNENLKKQLKANVSEVLEKDQVFITQECKKTREYI